MTVYMATAVDTEDLASLERTRTALIDGIRAQYRMPTCDGRATVNVYGTADALRAAATRLLALADALDTEIQDHDLGQLVE
jgi:hypothetical protein